MILQDGIIPGLLLFLSAMPTYFVEIPEIECSWRSSCQFLSHCHLHPPLVGIAAHLQHRTFLLAHGMLLTTQSVQLCIGKLSRPPPVTLRFLKSCSRLLFPCVWIISYASPCMFCGDPSFVRSPRNEWHCGVLNS